MGTTSPKPRLKEAGPGAGKTHAMVDEVVEAARVLPPHRFLAAITYTNAAANTIRERLHQRIALRPNVFIGTTHSFVNRFVLAPCAELLSMLPGERVFAAIDVHEKGRGAARYEMNLIKKGVVPYDSMVRVARKILDQPKIRDRLCGRVLYMFIDEFQDVDIATFEVFEHFRKAGKTSIFAVGDPEQYVMSFAYRGQRPPTFDKIPFFRFKKIARSSSVVENHRSNGEIVSFANQFRDGLEQRAIKPDRHEPRVVFIAETSLREIMLRFQDLTANVESEGNQRTRLYISEENATFDSVLEEFQLTPISNFGRRTRSLLGDVLELLSVALDRSSRKVCKDFRLSRLQLREIGIELLRGFREEEWTGEQLSKFVTARFGHKVSQARKRGLDDGIKPLGAEVRRRGGKSSTAIEQYASIRRAKGLQADAVLVVAKGLSELQRWLCIDRESRISDRQDKCRLGYVAFTRAREMVCLACLKPIDANTKQTLKELCVTIDS